MQNNFLYTLKRNTFFRNGIRLCERLFFLHNDFYVLHFYSYKFEKKKKNSVYEFQFLFLCTLSYLMISLFRTFMTKQNLQFFCILYKIREDFRYTYSVKMKQYFLSDLIALEKENVDLKQVSGLPYIYRLSLIILRKSY